MKPGAGVLLAGGGLDSTALMIWLVKKNVELEVMHVDYGQKAWYSEHLAVEYFANKYGLRTKSVRCDLRQVGHSSILSGFEIGKTQADNKLEGRNITLMSLAMTYASTIGFGKVFIGYHHEPETRPYPDATIEALGAMNQVAREAYKPALVIEAPFWKKTRLSIFKLGKELDSEFERRSFTCYEGRVTECGQCVHCLQKKEMVRQCAESSLVESTKA